MKGRRAVVLGASVLMLLAGIGVILLALGGSEKTVTRPEPVAFVVPTPRPVQNTAVPPTPVPEPTPIPSDAPIERILIPTLGVDAPVVVLGINRDGSMQEPKGPIEVGWYDWATPDYKGPRPYLTNGNWYFPGFGGNAVFAGHVDYINYRPAVFYRVGQLTPGEEIQVRLTDGVLYTYQVVSLQVYRAGEAPISEIINRTERESITLITCTGNFNPATLEYDKRIVVRAERVADGSAEAP